MLADLHAFVCLFLVYCYRSTLLFLLLFACLYIYWSYAVYDCWYRIFNLLPLTLLPVVLWPVVLLSLTLLPLTGL